MLVYGNPITDWMAALAVFVLLYTATMCAVWAGMKAVERKQERGDAGQDE